ncbi:hypothetical protein LCM20_12545 [Halobacillus litoralis]|uniref:hypothetical protein n=1 Tax=Halobacillus litoralis TaxID=45668 RepID=UPI001CD5BDBD|nr:hypothetical protein [Halobacillus litoralis]MCA0971426.1 hypothetical protein [Halobacillus litoralis]
MKGNLVTGTLVLLLIGVIFVIADTGLDFHEQVLIMSAVSIVMMSVLRKSLVFLYAISMILAFGLFLIVYAFINGHSSNTMQVKYIYIHLLFTSVMIIGWILFSYLKNLGNHVSALQHQVNWLQRYDQDTHVLTVNEFQERAKWVMTSVNRNQSEAWLVDLEVDRENTHLANVRSTIEEASRQSIRTHFDLVTSLNNHIYLLLKDTHGEGVDIVLERINNQIREKFNLLEPPFTVTKTLVKDEEFLEKIGADSS